MGIGDWGLGPIPNPQSPIPIQYNQYNQYNHNSKIIKYKKQVIIKFKLYF